jgi:hypothetical protein
MLNILFTKKITKKELKTNKKNIENQVKTI